jgi:alkanesulfonate monooxygenase SsuD/methylene tetrahydromethanopterin reductase-like flavin-dependent oxidoreductase (luciferase family)
MSSNEAAICGFILLACVLGYVWSSAEAEPEVDPVPPITISVPVAPPPGNAGRVEELEAEIARMHADGVVVEQSEPPMIESRSQSVKKHRRLFGRRRR